MWCRNLSPLISHSSRTPIVALVLKRQNAFEAIHAIYPQLDHFYYTHTPYLALRDLQLLFPRKPLLERTLALIKPGFSQDEADTIIEAITQNNFVIVSKTARVLTPEVAALLVGTTRTEDLKFLTSDVSIALVLEKPGAVDDWRLLLGPEDPEEARTHAPYSLRARLGTDLVHNVAYGSPSVNKASQDIVAFFPKPFPLERSVLLVKPDLAPRVDVVLDMLAEYGFTIIAKDRVTLSKTRCESLYAHLKSAPYFSELISFMSSGECVPILVSKPAAIASLRALVGPSNPEVARKYAPHSLRAQFATNEICNAADCSADAVQVASDVANFFPQLAAESIPVGDEIETLLSKRTGPFRSGVGAPKSLRDVLCEGLTQLCKVKPVGNDAIRWLAHWLLRNNPSKPKVDLPEDPEEEEEYAKARALAIPTNIASPAHPTHTASTQDLPQVTVLKAVDHKQVPVKVEFDGADDDELPPPATRQLQAALGVPVPAKDTHLSGAKVVSLEAKPKPPRVVMALGAPGSGADAIVRELCASTKMECIHVPSLLEAAESQGTEFGRILAQARALHRQPPSHIVATLIQRAIAEVCLPLNSPRGFILIGFPLSLDDAFAFERLMGAPELVLLFSCSEDAALARVYAGSEQKQSAQSQADVLGSIKAVTEQIAPVIEHYVTFKKVLQINTDDTVSSPADFTKTVVVPKLLSTLKAPEVNERPAKRVAPHKPKPAVVAVEE